MAGIRIDALPTTVLPSSEHEFPAMKDGLTVKLTLEQVAAVMLALGLIDADTAATLTNKTLVTPTLTLKQGAAVAPTAEGDAQWDTDDNELAIGDGAATRRFADKSKQVQKSGDTMSGGLLMGAGTTGGDPGAGKINAAEFRENNRKLSNVLLASGAISNAVSLDIDLSTYIAAGFRKFQLKVPNLKPATNAVSALLRASIDGGASFLSTGTYHQGGGGFSTGSTAVQSVVHTKTATSVQLSNAAIGNGVDKEAYLTLEFDCLTTHFICQAFMAYEVSATIEQCEQFMRGRHNTANINAIRLLMSSGNITSGDWALYGIKT